MRFRKSVFAVLLLLIVIQVRATVWDVSLDGTMFTPPHLDILQGDTVRWTNNDGYHSVTQICDRGVFGTLPADPPWVYEFPFDVPLGSYAYICEIHPDMMQGQISVHRRGRWDVTVQSYSFTPPLITLTPGDTVVWTNIDGFHSVFSTHSPSLFGNVPGDAPWDYSFIFNLPVGSYDYVCAIHPTRMSGTINIVTPLEQRQDPPSDVTIYPDGFGDVVLNWTGPCYDAFKVYRSTTDADWSGATLMATVINSTTYTEPMDPDAPHYFYRVTALY